MGVGSGLGANVGFGPETAYGTAAALTRWVEITSETVKSKPMWVTNEGLAGGVLVNRGSQRTRVAESAEGDVVVVGRPKNSGLLLAQAMGSSAVPAQFGTTPAYTLTMGVADNLGKSVTMQKLINDASGSAHPFTAVGGKVKSLAIACGANEQMVITLGMDFQRIIESVAAGAPTYPSGNPPLLFRGAGFIIGAYGSEVAVPGIKKLTTTLTRPQKTDRQYFGGQGLKYEPVTNGRITLAGSLEVDLTAAVYSALVESFRTDAPLSAYASYVGAPIAGAVIATTLTALTAVGANQVTTAAAVLPGAILTIDTGALLETATVVAVNGLVATLAAPLVNAHASGATVSAQLCYAMQLAIPQILLGGDDPAIAGPDIISETLPFDMYYDDTHTPFTITLVTTDTTL